MPSNGFVRVFPDSTGKNIDTEAITSGPSTYHRQRVRIGGEALGDLADVVNGALAVTERHLGTESDSVSDPGPSGDGLVDLTTGPDLLVSIPVAAGQTYYLTGWTWLSDRLALFRLEIDDAGTLVESIRLMANSGSSPGDTMNFPTPIQIQGALNREIRVKVQRLDPEAGGRAHAAVNGYLV